MLLARTTCQLDHTSASAAGGAGMSDSFAWGPTATACTESCSISPARRRSSMTQLLGPVQIWEGRGAAVACQAELKSHRRRTA